jgi:hypothetical protein
MAVVPPTCPDRFGLLGSALGAPAVGPSDHVLEHKTPTGFSLTRDAGLPKIGAASAVLTRPRR